MKDLISALSRVISRAMVRSKQSFLARLIAARRKEPGPSLKLYQTAVDQARLPGFYKDWGVADTVDGRFDLITLHVFLLIDRLAAGSQAELAQALFDDFFADMDENLREMGAGDLGVGKRVKKMAAAFMGRQQAYGEALAQKDDGALLDVLQRNLYRSREVPAEKLKVMAAYVRGQVAHLAGLSIESLAEGKANFAPLG